MTQNKNPTVIRMNIGLNQASRCSSASEQIQLLQVKTRNDDGQQREN